MLLDEILALLQTEAGAVWIYQPSSGKLRFAAARGWFSLLDEASIKPDGGIIGTVFSSKQHISREFASDPLLKLPEGIQIPEGWGGICVPIRAADETVGVFTVSVPLPREVTPEESKLLASLGDMAGIAVHRISLHEETTRQLQKLQALHAVDSAINASLDLRFTLNVLLEHVTVQLGVDAAGVLLLHPGLKMLEYAAVRGFRTNAIEQTRLRLGESCAGKAALERRTVQVRNPAEAPDEKCASLLKAEGFTACVSVPLIAKGEVKGVLEVFQQKPFSPDAEWLNFLETMAGQAAIAVDNARLFEGMQHANLELVPAYDATIEGWAHALGMRDEETAGHSRRVTEITLDISRKMGMNEEKLVHVRRGALLHDIGKMGIPDAILLKPGKLTEEEWEIMRRHTIYAYQMLSCIEYLRPALEIPYCHHEKWTVLVTPAASRAKRSHWKHASSPWWMFSMP